MINLVMLGTIAIAGLSPLKGLKLIPGGENIGIELKADGLVVSGTYDVFDKERRIYNPTRDNDIKKGDLLTSLNEIRIKSLKDFQDVLSTYTEASSLKVELLRDGDSLTRDLKLLSSGNERKTGLLVKEHLLGIGTVSFYNPDDMTYGALGHEIADPTYPEIFKNKDGLIYDSKVLGFKKGQDGVVGEKLASINENINLGTIKSNNNYGIKGSIYSLPEGKVALDVATHSEVRKGEAEILTVIEGQSPERFDIEILNLSPNNYVSTKGITFKVTDKELLSKTNGIVAGMSGSPIIQNGKLVGAVTHVKVDDCDHGYGVFMEWMYQGLI